MRRVLVTGASGFIGRHCLGPLLDRGYEVHAVARRPIASRPGVIWHRTDLLEPGCAADLADRVRATHLLHLAWYAVPGRYWTAPENTSWVAASVELVEAFARAGGHRAVCGGTCAEYVWDGSLCDEASTPLSPSTPYGRSKVELHHRLRAMAERTGLSLGWGRIFLLYGRHEHAERLVPSVILSLLSQLPVQCTDGTQVRDFLHVEDVASAFVALLESKVHGAVNIASGVPVSIREIVGSLALLVGGGEFPLFGSVARHANDPPFLVADIGRLRDRVRWRPRFTLGEGLADAIEWWRQAATERRLGSDDPSGWRNAATARPPPAPALQLTACTGSRDPARERAGARVAPKLRAR